MEVFKIEKYLDKGITLTEQGYDGLDHHMSLVFDELDDQRALKQMKEKNNGGMR